MAKKSDPQPGLGQAIRELRLEKGLTQEELAHRADLHPTWISHLESGRVNPVWANVKKLARALDTSLSDLAARAEKLDR